MKQQQTHQSSPSPVPGALSLELTVAATAQGLTLCNNNALRKATRNVGQLFDDVIEPIGLRAAQFGLLAHIHALDRPTMKTLAQTLVMDLSALGHTLKPLVRDGYVDLIPDEDDRRSKRVSLTQAGLAKYAEGTLRWHDAQGRVERILGVEKARELCAALSVLASEDFADAFRAAAVLS